MAWCETWAPDFLTIIISCITTKNRKKQKRYIFCQGTLSLCPIMSHTFTNLPLYQGVTNKLVGVNTKHERTKQVIDIAHTLVGDDQFICYGWAELSLSI